MIICGLEEPLQENEMIYTLNEQTGVVTTGEVWNDNLNRYSFVWLGLWEDGPRNLSRLMAAILEQLGEAATWLSAWRTPHHSNTSADIVLRKVANELQFRREREGWAIHHEDGLAIATTPVDTRKLEADTLWPTDPPNKNLALIIGDVVSHGEFSESILRPSMEMLARRGNPVPSKEFLNWLADKNLMVVYREKDDLGRPGVIFVGSQRINTNIFLERGLVTQVVSPDASLVWRFGPMVKGTG